MVNIYEEIDLYPLLPPTVKEFEEFKEITQAQIAEFNRIRAHLIGIFKDRFVYEATENGLRRWEKMLKIQRRSTDTLEERRFRILAKMNNRLPYTFKALIQRLNALCGEGKYQVFLDANAYELDFEFFEKIADVKLLKDTMEEMIPVNLALEYNYVIRVPNIVVIPKAHFYPVIYPICGLAVATNYEKGTSGRVSAEGKLKGFAYEVPYVASDMSITY
ncbi:putative phage tail protein [Psychrobacillus sp. NPDC096389]|uniref:putative phage tail protein n=1 Tax=Psychrobacillus sp. NPDC096389 TaxID=3364490 RepID=UPI00381E4A6E